MNAPTSTPDAHTLNRRMLDAARETGLTLPPAIERAFVATPGTSTPEWLGSLFAREGGGRHF